MRGSKYVSHRRFGALDIRKRADGGVVIATSKGVFLLTHRQAEKLGLQLIRAAERALKRKAS